MTQKMHEWIIIDGDDVNRFNAKRIRAVHPTAIPPVHITRVVAGDYEGELSLLIHTNMRVDIEDCVDSGCKHLVAQGSASKQLLQREGSHPA